MVEFGSSDSAEHGEYIRDDFADISIILGTRNDFVLRGIPFDREYSVGISLMFNVTKDSLAVTDASHDLFFLFDFINYLL